MMRMKSLLVVLLLACSMLWGAYLKDVPTKVTEPNGNTIECYASGDDFYSWLHDKDGYTIIQHENGYYYYGQKKGGLIVPSAHKVSEKDAATIGLKKWQKISRDMYLKRKNVFEKNITKSSKAIGKERAWAGCIIDTCSTA